MSEQQDLLRLLSNTASGDAAAFERLYEKTACRLFGLSLRMLRRHDLAEEVLQEAYVRIWHHASEYHAQRGAVMTWMMSILRYRALDRLRVRKRTERLDEKRAEQIPDDAAEPFVLAVEGQSAFALKNCMQKLTDVQRQCILLAFFNGMTHLELANRIQKPIGTVKSWIRRGLASLRRCLER